MAGFVYIMSNPSYGSILKIGMSDFDPAKRKSDLYSTAVPDPFKIEYYAYVENHRKLEYKIHNALKEYRHRANREFINCEIHQAIETIRKVSGQQLKYEENNSPEESTITLSKVFGNKNNIKDENIVLDKVVNIHDETNNDYTNLGFPFRSLFKHKNLEIKKDKKDKPSSLDSINIIISLIIFCLIVFVGIINDFSADAILFFLMVWWIITLFYMLMTKTAGVIPMILILVGILFIYSNLEIFMLS